MKLFVFLSAAILANAANLPLIAKPESLQARQPAVIVNPNVNFVRTTPQSPRAKTKRVTFASNADDENCGEVNPTVWYGSTDPLVSDCNAIASYVTAIGPGQFTISAAEFAGSGSGWVTVVSSGTCAYKFKPSSPSPADYAKIGTNDIRFQITTTARSSPNGRIRAQGGVACYFDGTSIFGQFGMLSP